MEIFITQWALDSYLELKSKRALSKNVYWDIIRPDVLRLRSYPHEPKFSQSKFWSVAQDQNGRTISNGFKMKWHQIGEGKVQLRLTVAIFDSNCFLCEAYVKENAKKEKRQLARFKTFLQLLRGNRYTIRGRLK